MLKKLFGVFSRNKPEPNTGVSSVDPVGDEYLPKNGIFFQTLEYPVLGEDNKTIIGRTWMEAAYDPEKKSWALVLNSVKEMEDIFQGGTKFVLNNTVLFESTSMVNSYAQMDSFAKSQDAQNIQPLDNKTKEKLGDHYYRQFAWVEGLMMSRSGRLYPADKKLLATGNFFDQQDIDDAKVFIERHNEIKFMPVAITIPATNWDKYYQANKEKIDSRLSLLRNRHKDDTDNGYALARQIIAHEDPAILYAYLKEGFNPKAFEGNAEQHFGILKAAIDRDNVEPLNLLSESGLQFFVRYDEETPVEVALHQKRYSHLHVMLKRDGTKLANYADETGISPAIQAVILRDNQAFQMLYLEGVNFSQADDKGWYLVHHAFDNDFLRGIYAWVDEPLPIDHAIEGTEFTGVSIAKAKKNDVLLDLARKYGANIDAPALSQTVEKQDQDVDIVAEEKTIAEFSLDMLNGTHTNDEIKQSAKAYLKAGGELNILSDNNEALLEICWKNHKKTKPEYDRRALIEFFGELGTDPSASLSDGTTVLTREAKSRDIDMNFIKAIAPYTQNVNNPGLGGHNVMHALQLNANDQVGHSRNIKAILELFPDLDLNAQNDNGYSNIGLAIRLNRSKTLQLFVKDLLMDDKVADLTQITKADWSYLDIAFTSAFTDEKCDDFPLWANKIDKISDTLRDAVLNLVKSAVLSGDSEQTNVVRGVLNRTRPDGQTLGQAMMGEKVSGQLINDLAICGMQKSAGSSGPSHQPG